MARLGLRHPLNSLLRGQQTHLGLNRLAGIVIDKVNQRSIGVRGWSVVHLVLHLPFLSPLRGQQAHLGLSRPLGRDCNRVFRGSIAVRGVGVARQSLHRLLHTLLGSLQVQRFLILESQLGSDLEKRIVAEML